MIEKFGEDAGLRFEDGIDALRGDFGTLGYALNRHAGITLGFEKLARGFNDATAGIAGLALADEGGVGALFGLHHSGKYFSIL